MERQTLWLVTKVFDHEGEEPYLLFRDATEALAWMHQQDFRDPWADCFHVWEVDLPEPNCPSECRERFNLGVHKER